ncbi:MAG: hypothetical protein J6U05_05260 [Neisseriaceae bacterium]|nr:hypothetical protein [Neisseriaceae bacterium]
MQTRKSFPLSILAATLLATVPAVSSAGDIYKIEHDGQSLIWYFNGALQGSFEGNFNNEKLKNQSDNTVNVNLGSNTFTGNIYGGQVTDYIQNSDGSYTYTSAGNNIVTITGGIVNNSHVYGGYAKYADASNNTVEIEDNNNHVQVAMFGDIYGGYTDNYHTVGNNTVFGNANSNKVTVNNSGLDLDYSSYGPGVYGAYAYGAGSTNGNSVTITNSKVREVKGAYNFQGNHRGGADNNTVTVTNSEVYDEVRGAEAVHNYVSANNNTVIVTNSKTGTVRGAYSWGTDAANTNNNTVIFDNSTTGLIYGAWSLSSANKNSVVVKGNSSTRHEVQGAFGEDGSANNNSVSIEGNSYIDNNVYGGYGGSEANGNTVSIKDNTHVHGNVYGGYHRGNNRVSSNKATGNTVIISSQYAAVGSTEDTYSKYTISGNGNIYGGYSWANGATGDNTVTFTGGQTVRLGVYGGNTTLTGNTLNLGESAAKPLSNTVEASNIYNFENINVYLPSSVTDGFTALQLTGKDETNLKQTNVNAYLQNAKGLTADSKIHLIQATDGTLTAPKNNGATQSNVKVDIAGLINVIGKVQLTDNKNLDLVFSGDNAPVVVPKPKDNTYNVLSDTQYSRLHDDGKTKNIDYKNNQFNTENEVSGSPVKVNVKDTTTKTTNAQVNGSLKGKTAFNVNNATINSLLLHESDNTADIQNATVGKIQGGAGDVSLQSSKVTNDIALTGGKVTADNSAISGVIKTTGAVSLSNGSSANSISTDGDIALNKATVSQDVTSNQGNLKIENGSKVGGVINTKGKVTVSNDSSVNNISTDDDIALNQATVSQDVTSNKGNLNLESTTVSGNASGNTVTLNGKTTVSGSVKGETVNVGASQDNKLSAMNSVSVGNLLNVGTLNFFLPDSVKNGDIAMKITGKDNTDLKDTQVNAYLQNAQGLTADSTIHLLQHKDGDIVNFDAKNGKAEVANVSIAGLINVVGKVKLTDSKNLDLTFSGNTTPVDPTPVDPTPVDPTPVDPTPVDPTPVKPIPTAGANSKLLLENKLSLAAMLNSAGDTMTDNIAQNANAHGSDSVFTFGSINGGKKRSETGSYVDVKGFNLNAGVGANNEIGSGNLNTGLFLEYGRSDFDAHLDNGATSSGDAYYYGAGAYTRYTLSGFYGEGSLRGGKVKTKHNAGLFDAYKLSNHYIGAHIGVGKQFAFGNNELDLYTRYHYLHTNDNDFEVNGVKVHTDSINSQRVKVGVKDTIKFTDNHAMYVGGAYQYAFKANANGTVSAVGQTAEIVSPKFKGSTGIGELGYTYKAGGVQFSVGATGYVGKEKGVGANAELKYTF